MKIWIVEDEAPQRMLLCDLARQACGKHGVKADIVALKSGESLTNAYQPGADLLLLDIDMPGINGMDAAHIIRQKDERVLIAFCTNLVSRALDGYAVAAMDFLVKPVTAARIDELLDKVFHRLSVAAPVTLTLHTQDSTNTPISGLYATGNNVSGLSVAAYVNIEGTGLGFAPTSGRLAGANAAATIQ